MNIRTVTVTVPASRDIVFNFLAEIENLPLWATEFSQRVYSKDGRWMTTTSQGDLFIEIAADAGTGVIDLRAGPTPERMGLFPLRVVPFAAGAAASFTFFQPPGLPDELYERQYASLLVEMRGLLARFGGGELHAAPAAGE